MHESWPSNPTQIPIQVVVHPLFGLLQIPPTPFFALSLNYYSFIIPISFHFISFPSLPIIIFIYFYYYCHCFLCFIASVFWVLTEREKWMIPVTVFLSECVFSPLTTIQLVSWFWKLFSVDVNTTVRFGSIVLLFSFKFSFLCSIYVYNQCITIMIIHKSIICVEIWFIFYIYFMSV